MANYYAVTTAVCGIKCSDEDYEDLIEAISKEKEDEDGEPIQVNFECLLSQENGEQQLYICSDSDYSANIDDVPEPALKVIGRIVEKAGLPYWEFSVGYYCDKPRPGSAGGDAFRIYPDGSVRFAELKWD